MTVCIVGTAVILGKKVDCLERLLDDTFALKDVRGPFISVLRENRKPNQIHEKVFQYGRSSPLKLRCYRNRINVANEAFFMRCSELLLAGT